MPNKLREFREAAGLSQTELGGLYGEHTGRKIGQSLIAQVEGDFRRAYPLFKKIMAKIFNVCEDEIFPPGDADD